MEKQIIKFKLNGEEKEFFGELGAVAKDFLRENGIISLREGCDGEGACGLCSIILDGKVVNSCILIVGQLTGREIYTTSFFAGKNSMDKLQKAMLMAGVVQCGYCSPAIYNAFNRLLANNQNPSKEDVADALSATYCRCTGYQQMYDVIEIYKLLMRDQKIPEQKIKKEFRVIESSVCKFDGGRLVKGEQSYVEDYVEKDSYILKFLGSPHASAYIKNIDTKEAEKLSGVEYILTYKNSPKKVYGRSGQTFPEPSPYDRQLITQKIHHYGDRVAAIVAKNKEIAEQALKLIKVEYEILKPVLSAEEAIKDGAPIVHGGIIQYKEGAPENIDNNKCDSRETPIIYNFPIAGDPRKNLVGSTGGEFGDVKKAFADGDVVLERKYKTSKINLSPMETHSVFTKIEDGRLIVVASNQVPWHLRRIIANVLDISENKIRVIKPYIGGGFGAKQDVSMEEVAAYLTWITGKSIYCRMTREEQFTMSTSRHNVDYSIKMSAKKDGTITGIDLDILTNTGGYGNNAWTVGLLTYNIPVSLYNIPNVKYKMQAMYTNLTNAGAARGYGATQGTYAMAMLTREMSNELGIEYTEFLKKNLLNKGDLIPLGAFFEGKGQEHVEKIESYGIFEAIEKGKQMIDWGKKPESQNSNIKIGQGMAIMQQESGLPYLDAANANVTLLNDGTFVIRFGGTDMGQGLNSAAVQVAAECLKIDMKDISFVTADTDTTPYDVGSYASSGTQFSIGAVINAAKDMREKIKIAASEILGEPVEKLKLDYPAKVIGGKREISFSEIGTLAISGVGKGEIVGTGNFTIEKHVTPYAAHFCEIELNTDTGKVKVKKYYAIHDCGIPINPTLTRGQIFGGVAQSIGYALYEEMKFDSSGKLLNPNFLDYKMPKIKDMPEDFRVEFVYTDSEEEFGNRKSVGEISVNGGAPAIANAIFDATGIWMRDLPFTQEKILKELGKVKK
ncbi:MAG: molybdopterin cofactor-binding domain-containing protein [Fusobacteriaceae bacterium]